MGVFLDMETFKRQAASHSCLVVGDVILDQYVYGDVNRISPEAPVPIVKALDEEYRLGGAANVAGNISGLYVTSYLCGVLGDDEQANILSSLFDAYGIAFSGITSLNRNTTKKTRIVSMNQQLLRIDHEVNEYLSNEEEHDLLEKIGLLIDRVDIVVVSDYSKGVCSESLCRNILKTCRDHEKKVIVDPKCSNWGKYQGAYLITPNFKEFCEALHCVFSNTEYNIQEHAIRLMHQYNLENILVTRSKDGMTLVNNQRAPFTLPSVQHEVYDVSGAGDTVVASIAASLAIGRDLKTSLAFANCAAGVAVSKSGTYVIQAKEAIACYNKILATKVM